MNFKPANTLAYHDSLPQKKAIDLGHLPVSTLAINCQKFMGDHGASEKPEAQAMRFYGLNHLASLVKERFTQHEELPEWANETMHAYGEELGVAANRMMFYLLMIITREARHLPGGASYKASLKAAHGKNFYDFIIANLGAGESSAVNKLLTAPPDCDLQTYVGGMVHIFNEGPWVGGSYGGKPWGQIAQCLYNFVTGKTSLEVMLDTSFTLCHNNGPIFNKGMIYQHYEGGHPLPLVRILDIQRSGQIPELIFSNSLKYLLGNPVLKLFDYVREELPGVFGKEVDYYKVEALGSVAKYPMEKAAMAKKPEPVQAYINNKKVLGKLKIMPKVSVSIVERSV